MTRKIIKCIEFDPEFRPVVIGPVLKKEVVTAYGQAKSIVSKARKEASAIRNEAKEVLKQAVAEKEVERQRGYQEGLEDGLEQLSEKIFEAELSKEKALSEAEPQIIRMVMDIAEKVIGREVAEGAIVDVVKKAISQAVGKKIVVRIHPSDGHILKEREKELSAALDQTQSVAIREDEEVPAGGCVVETEMGAVDARLETQIAGIKKALGLGE